MALRVLAHSTTPPMNNVGWYETLDSNVSAADAILDRVVNTASRFTLKGDSLRKKHVTLPRQNCNSMAVFAVTVCSVFANW